MSLKPISLRARNWLISMAPARRVVPGTARKPPLPASGRMVVAEGAGIAVAMCTTSGEPSRAGVTVVRLRDTIVPSRNRKKVVSVSTVPPLPGLTSVKQRVAVPMLLLVTASVMSASKQLPSLVVLVGSIGGMVRVSPMALPLSCTMRVRLWSGVTALAKTLRPVVSIAIVIRMVLYIAFSFLYWGKRPYAMEPAAHKLVTSPRYDKLCQQGSKYYAICTGVSMHFVLRDPVRLSYSARY